MHLADRVVARRERRKWTVLRVLEARGNRLAFARHRVGQRKPGEWRYCTQGG